MAYLLLYVYDIILNASTNDLQKYLMASLSSGFAMEDLGHLNDYLGISVTQHKGGLFLLQQKYAEEIIDRDGMTFYKSTQTLVDTKSKIVLK